MARFTVLLVAVAFLAGCQQDQYVSRPSLSPPQVGHVMAQGHPADTIKPLPYDPSRSPLVKVQPQPQIPPQVSGPARGRVIIDPGHGGKDPGTHSATGIIEKTLVLAVARRVTENLRARGVDAMLTRATDVFIELDDRAGAANRMKADLFVSIHADWNPSSSKRGHTILLPQAGSPRAAVAAQAISRAMAAAGSMCYNIRRDTRGLVVLRKTLCPAVLVEMGFLSNPSDTALLSSATFQQRLADGIAEGIANYLRAK